MVATLREWARVDLSRWSRRLIEAWRLDYNVLPAHNGLNDLVPSKLAARSLPEHNRNGFGP
jgi:hypothetical protein